MKRYIAQTRAQPRRLYRRQMDAPVRLPMGDSGCAGCGEEGLGQTTYQPKGTFTRGVFDQVQPYAIPGYVRAEPDGVDGIASYNPDVDLPSMSGGWYETPSGDGVFKPVQPWATPGYAVQKSNFGQPPVITQSEVQLLVTNCLRQVQTTSDVKNSTCYSILQQVAATPTKFANLGVSVANIAAAQAYIKSSKGLPKSSKGLSNSILATIKSTLHTLNEEQKKQPGWRPLGKNASVADVAGVLTDKLLLFIKAWVNMIPDNTAKFAATGVVNELGKIGLQQLRAVLSKPVAQLSGGAQRGMKVKMDLDGLKAYLKDQIRDFDLCTTYLVPIIGDKKLCLFSTLSALKVGIPSKDQLIEMAVDLAWGEISKACEDGFFFAKENPCTGIRVIAAANGMHIASLTPEGCNGGTTRGVDFTLERVQKALPPTYSLAYGQPCQPGYTGKAVGIINFKASGFLDGPDGAGFPPGSPLIKCSATPAHAGNISNTVATFSKQLKIDPKSLTPTITQSEVQLLVTNCLRQVQTTSDVKNSTCYSILQQVAATPTKFANLGVSAANIAAAQAYIKTKKTTGGSTNGTGTGTKSKIPLIIGGAAIALLAFKFLR